MMFKAPSPTQDGALKVLASLFSLEDGANGVSGLKRFAGFPGSNFWPIKWAILMKLIRGVKAILRVKLVRRIEHLSTRPIGFDCPYPKPRSCSGFFCVKRAGGVE